MQIQIPNSTENYMYHTTDNISHIEIGYIVDVGFGSKKYKVDKKYLGKKITFYVNNIKDYNKCGTNYRTLALVSIDKKDNFLESDILYIAQTQRVKNIISALFPENRIEFFGWKNKEVIITNHRPTC